MRVQRVGTVSWRGACPTAANTAVDLTPTRNSGSKHAPLIDGNRAILGSGLWDLIGCSVEILLAAGDRTWTAAQAVAHENNISACTLALTVDGQEVELPLDTFPGCGIEVEGTSPGATLTTGIVSYRLKSEEVLRPRFVGCKPEARITAQLRFDGTTYNATGAFSVVLHTVWASN